MRPWLRDLLVGMDRLCHNDRYGGVGQVALQLLAVKAKTRASEVSFRAKIAVAECSRWGCSGAGRGVREAFLFRGQHTVVGLSRDSCIHW